MSVPALLSAVERLHTATPALSAFALWPQDLIPNNLAPEPCPLVANLGAMADIATHPILTALITAAPSLRWKQSYTAEEVGHPFLETYGYVELFGPDGQFHSATSRGYIGIWGPGLTYDWHAHEAEEMYYCLAGDGVFIADGVPSVHLRPGATRTHHSNQRHMMVTLENPIFTYVVWRGAGLAGLPKLVRQ